MAETILGGGHKAQVVGIKKSESKVSLKIRYYVRFLFWSRDSVFKTEIKPSAPELYKEALMLKRGDDVWAIPDENHEITSCYHYGFFKRLKNRLFF